MKAHITNFGIENFRVFKNKTQFEFAPITILTGTNSSGKSSLINAMEIVSETEANKEISNWGNPTLQKISERLSFNKFVISPSEVNKRFGRFSSILNVEMQYQNMKYFFETQFEYFNSFVEVGLQYKLDEIDKRKGKLVEIEMTDVKSKQSVLTIISNNLDRISVTIDYAFFFNKLNEFLNDNVLPPKKRYGLFDNITYLEDADSDPNLKEKVRDFIAQKKPFYNYGFGGMKRLDLETGDEYEDNDESSIQKSREKVLSMYPLYFDKEFNQDFFQKEEKKFLSTLSFDRKSKDSIRLDDLIGVFKTIKNPITYSYSWVENNSFISDFKKTEYTQTRFNKDYKKEIEFIFEEFILNSIIGVLNDAHVPKFSKLNTSRVNIERSYKDIDKESFSAQIGKIVTLINKKDSGAIQFLKLGLKALNIGENIEVKDGNDEASVIVYIIKRDSKILLADVGYGVSQILSVLFAITIKIDESIRSFSKSFVPTSETENTYNNFIHGSLQSELILVIEEPEASLHPANQSKLADIFYRVATKFGIQFIIETHSEYLIRKLQYLTAKGEIRPEDTVIYYFYPPDDVPPGEEQVKKINITEDGSLTDDFGSGFFDEADKIAMSIWNMNKSQKN